MRPISSDLSAKEAIFPEVEVLLATFNGEIYLAEFFESLLMQEGVKIHLIVSDDGSTDETLKIVDRYKHKFESWKILQGPRTGPSANFFHLINQATQEFIALADQDDVWLPNHLIDSIGRILETQELPSMTFSSVLEFSDTKRKEIVWPSRFPGKDIRTILTENLARGCTIVLNLHAVNLIKLYKPQNAIMHDWWILLVISATGNVSWSEEPEINYRIHKFNTIGKRPKFKIRAKRFISNLQGDKWPIVSQAEELLSAYSWSMSGQNRYQISEFLQNIKSIHFSKRLNLIKFHGRFRMSLLDEIAVRIFILLKSKYLFKGNKY